MSFFLRIVVRLPWVLIGLSQVTQSVAFNNPTGNYTVNSFAGQTLSGLTAINVAAAVTGVQTIDLANVAAGSLVSPTDSYLTVTNNSNAANTTLVIGPNTVISTPGAGALVVDGAGTTQISGSIHNGGVVKNGLGTLILSNPVNGYLGGTGVNAGTLSIAANGAVIPAGTSVIVNPGATLDLGNSTNGLANAVANVTLGGTLKASGTNNNSDFYTQSLTMSGGTIDFTNTPYTWIHVIGAGGITTTASATTAQWIVGNGTVLFPHIQNDTANPMNITVAAGTTPSGIDLDAGIMLANGSNGKGFVKAGAGTMRLTNPGNTADITVGRGNLRVDDMAALGSGIVTLGHDSNPATLQYGGPTASSTKTLGIGSPIASSATIQVLTDGANLTLNGAITGGDTNGLNVVGSGLPGTSSTLTLTATNTYSYVTSVSKNAVLAVPTITNSNVPSPIGSAAGGEDFGVFLGAADSRGTLMLTGTAPLYSTDRLLAVTGRYADGGGGAIGVQNAGTSLSWNGVIGEFSGMSGSLIKTGTADSP